MRNGVCRNAVILQLFRCLSAVHPVTLNILERRRQIAFVLLNIFDLRSPKNDESRSGVERNEKTERQKQSGSGGVLYPLTSYLSPFWT